MVVGALHVPQGAGRQRITKLTGPDNSIHTKRSMVQIVNDDQLCMARAIGVGLAKKCLVSEDDWDRTKQNALHLSNPEILLKHRKTNIQNVCNVCGCV